MRKEQPTQRESLPEINWVRPNIQDEMGEIERTVKTIRKSDEHHQKTMQEIIEAVRNAHLEELAGGMWRILQNTDPIITYDPNIWRMSEKLL